MINCSAEITVFVKNGGPLSKHIELLDGKIANDSSSCRMAKGDARRVKIDLADMTSFADLINGFSPKEAYAIGRLKDGLPDCVRIVRDDKLDEAKGDPTVIARTKDNIVFVDGEPGLVLQDIDLKGIPETTKSRIKETGVWAALCAVVPALASAARVVRPSTSHGLRNTETGETYAGSGGFHAVTAVADAADIPRFLSDFHDRLWLAGWGWGMASAAGSFLDRSLVDKACGSPERLIFEGPPIIVPPLEQAPRPAVAYPGDIIDTRTACPPLSDAEKEELERLKRAERARLKPQLDEARAKWSAGHIRRLIASGMPEPWARAQVDRWLDHHELSGDFPLPFDDSKLAGMTVAEVLANPNKYVGRTLADPFEGPAYGRGKAIVYQRENGSLFINSFAHGGARYELKPAPKPTKFKLVPFEDIEFAAAQEWLVKKLLPCQGVAPIFGASMAFKSFVAMDLGLHVALGWNWAGRKTKQGPVIYIAAENSPGVRKRKVGFEMAHDANLPHRVPFFLIEAAPNLGTEKNDREALIASVEAFGVAPTLIIIDTLAQTLGGGEENSTGMVTFLSNATALANHFKCCVVPVHHAPLADDKRMRGHSSLHAGVDALVRAERKGVDLVTVLSLDKLRDEEAGIGLTVRLVRIVLAHDEDGEEISTLVVSNIEEGGVAVSARAPKDEPAKVIPGQRRLLMEMVNLAIDEAGQNILSFGNGPVVRATPEEAVRRRFYIRIAEQADPNETLAKIEERRRKAFNRNVEAALKAKELMAKGIDGVRFLWLP